MKIPGVQRPHITGQPARTAEPNLLWLHQLGGQPGLALQYECVFSQYTVKQHIKLVSQYSAAAEATFNNLSQLTLARVCVVLKRRR